MPWGTVDDGFYDHDKVLELPAAIRNEACGLYWRANSYCNAKLTDGFVSDSVIEHLNGTPALIDALVSVRLWHRRRGGGVTVHDFLDGYNKSRDQVQKDRAKKAEAGRLGGRRSGEARRKQTGSTAEASASRVPKHVLRDRLNSESESDSVSITPPTPSQARGRRRAGRSNGLSHGAAYYDAQVKGDPEVDDKPKPVADLEFVG